MSQVKIQTFNPFLLLLGATSRAQKVQLESLARRDEILVNPEGGWVYMQKRYTSIVKPKTQIFQSPSQHQETPQTIPNWIRKKASPIAKSAIFLGVINYSGGWLNHMAKKKRNLLHRINKHWMENLHRTRNPLFHPQTLPKNCSTVSEICLFCGLSRRWRVRGWCPSLDTPSGVAAKIRFGWNLWQGEIKTIPCREKFFVCPLRRFSTGDNLFTGQLNWVRILIRIRELFYHEFSLFIPFKPE